MSTDKKKSRWADEMSGAAQAAVTAPVEPPMNYSKPLNFQDSAFIIVNKSFILKNK